MMEKKLAFWMNTWNAMGQSMVCLEWKVGGNWRKKLQSRLVPDSKNPDGPVYHLEMLLATKCQLTVAQVIMAFVNSANDLEAGSSRYFAAIQWCHWGHRDFLFCCVFVFVFLWSCTEGDSKSFFLGGDFYKYRYWHFTQKTVQEEESCLTDLVVLAFLTE